VPQQCPIASCWSTRIINLSAAGSFVDWNKSSRGWWPFCDFIAHSVVEAPDGRLIDLILGQASQHYPFLRHDGPEGQFEAIVRAGHVHLSCAIDVE
jgi:hypothetical protein